MMKKLLLIALLASAFPAFGEAVDAEKDVVPPKPSAADIAAADKAVGSAPAVIKTSATAVKKKSFVESVKDNTLSKEETAQLRDLINSSKASALEPSVPTIPRSRAVTIDLSSGATPQVIRVSPRQGCSLSFADVSGRAWSLVNFTNFSPKTVTVLRPIEKASLLTIEAADVGGVGSFAAFIQNPANLSDVNSVIPITFTVLINQAETDYRIDAIIPAKSGGNGVASTASSIDSDGSLESALSGMTPANTKKAITSNPNMSAWIKGTGKDKTVIIRSRGILLAPAPISGKKMTSQDGMNVYQIPSTSLVTLHQDGSAYQVEIKEQL